MTIPLLCFMFGCSSAQKQKMQKFSVQYVDIFDTLSIITCYAYDQQQFDVYADKVYSRLLELHQQFDPYNSYDGINNIKTINDNAGIKTIEITPDMYKVLSFGKQAYTDTDGAINIAMGATLELWHNYRTNAIENNIVAIPNNDELALTAVFNDINALELTENTAYINKKGVSLNLGAIAKGYAADEAIEVLEQMGCVSAIVNLGGNVRCIGGNRTEKQHWTIGIQDPLNLSNVIAAVETSDNSIVSSGNYQRYYIYNNKKIHHIIDPKTLQPADNVNAVTVVCDDSMTGDMLSTALFILPRDKGIALAKKYDAKKIYYIDTDNVVSEIEIK